MRSPFAPIQAFAAKRSSFFSQRHKIDPKFSRESGSRIGQAKTIAVADQMALGHEAVEHPRAHVARQVVVAHPRLTKCCIPRSGALSQMPRPGRQAHQRFQHMGDVIIGKRKIFVPPLFAGTQQAAFVQLGEVQTGCLDRYAGLLRQFST